MWRKHSYIQVEYLFTLVTYFAVYKLAFYAFELLAIFVQQDEWVMCEWRRTRMHTMYVFAKLTFEISTVCNSTTALIFDRWIFIFHLVSTRPNTSLTHLPVGPHVYASVSALIQVMACRQFSAKPLPEPEKFRIKTQNFSFVKMY